MLKKLRIRFVIINMAIVTIMLGAIFLMLYHSTARNLEQESVQMMFNMGGTPGKIGVPDDLQRDMLLPYFSVQLDRQGEITEIDGGLFDLSDRELLQTLLQAATETEEDVGELEAYHFRFARMETPEGQRIVFADMSSEQATLQNLIRTFCVVGLLAILVFLGISILLAHLTVRPVEQTWKQQKQFVADASHELKTPLTVIMTDAELLNAPDCPPEDREKLSTGIIAMSRQMRGLVESLLQLARIDNGSLKKECGTVSFSEIVSEAALQFEPVFFEKELPFSYEIEPEITVKGDRAALKQLVDILLDNAQKYAQSGGDTMVKLCRSSSRQCRLEVSDRGDAIGEEDLKNIFKRFYRADRARTMNHSYGLGLSIAESVVQEHHGRLWAESSEGYNRFFAELPTK